MNKLAIISLLTLAASQAAAREVDSRLDADDDGRVTVSNLSGSITVEGWGRSEVHVTGTIDDDVEEFIFERDGREITIKVKAPDRRWGHKDVSAELTIRVPQDSSLDIGTVSADIDVSGVRGEQELQAVSGDVTTEAYSSDISAGTVSGDVEVESANGRSVGEWELSSVSGDVTAEGLSGSLSTEIVSGDIEIIDGTFRRIRAETVSGDIVLIGGLEDGGRIDMESVNGSIEIQFTGPVSARFDIETFNGRIRNCFGPKPERTSKYAPGLEVSFKEGAGEGRVSLATLNGSIEVCKE